jgi:hypothetical protein
MIDSKYKPIKINDEIYIIDSSDSVDTHEKKCVVFREKKIFFF